MAFLEMLTAVELFSVEVLVLCLFGAVGLMPSLLLPIKKLLMLVLWFPCSLVHAVVGGVVDAFTIEEE